MKHMDDKFTVDLFEKAKRGRPRKLNALTGAQRVKKCREKKND